MISRIVKVAMEMYSKWMKGDKSAIHPELRSAVFAIAIKNGGQHEVWTSPPPPLTPIRESERLMCILVGGIV